MRLLDRRLNGRLGDLIEDYAARAGGINIKKMGQMPGDSLPLPVGIAGQIHPVSLGGILLQCFDQISLAPDIYVFRLKIVLHINAKLAFRQIPQMPHGSPDSVPLAQIALNGLCLGRGLHQYQRAALPILLCLCLFRSRLLGSCFCRCFLRRRLLCRCLFRSCLHRLLLPGSLHRAACFFYLSFCLHLAHKTPSFTVRT